MRYEDKEYIKSLITVATGSLIIIITIIFISISKKADKPNKPSISCECKLNEVTP